MYMAGRFCRRITILFLFLIFLVPMSAVGASAECTPKTADEMWTSLVDVSNYTKIGVVALERLDPNTFYGPLYQTTYVRSHESVDINVISYDSEEIASADAQVFPTPTDSDDWVETSFRGHPAFERTTETISSEYIDYIVDLRVVDGCEVVRGLWREKARRYNQLVTLEDGKGSVELVVGAIIDGLDGRTGPYIEPSEINATSQEPRPSVVVLSNSIDRAMASDFFTFLDAQGIDVIHSTAGDFDQYKDKSFIVILGGPDAPEGVGEIVQGRLTMTEGNSIREEGAVKKFSKSNVWAWSQSVTILAGAGRQQTQKAHETYGEEIALIVK